MYMLEEGKVEVSKTMVMQAGGAENSSRDKVLTKLSAEDHAIFGEVALFEQNKRTATVVALTDCPLLEIGKADFLRLAEENPGSDIRSPGTSPSSSAPGCGRPARTRSN